MNKDKTICRCNAYSFPHRFLSGNCTGEQAVEAVFQNGSKCGDCPCYREWTEPHGERLGDCALMDKIEQGKTADRADLALCRGLSLIVENWE